MNARVAVKNTRSRTMRGAMLGTFSFMATIQTCCLASVIGVDVAHQTCVKAEMQAAVDAGAMAAEDMLLSQQSANDAKGIAAAINMTKRNFADGRAISADTNIQVNVSVSRSNNIPTTTVTATKPIFNMFATMLGRPQDKITVSAVAGAGQMKTATAVFPLTVINRNYQPGQAYTWYISDAPGLAPSLVTALAMGLTGTSTGSSPAPYPGTMLGAQTAAFLTTATSRNDQGILGLTGTVLDGGGGATGLGQAGTVLGGVLGPSVGTTGSSLQTLLTGGSNPDSSPDAMSLSMLVYWNKKVSANPTSGNFELTASTQPSSNLGGFPNIPAKPLMPPSLSVGQQVYCTSGANKITNNPLNTTAQYLQGANGNFTNVFQIPSYCQSRTIDGAGIPASNSNVQQGTVATWLTGQTVNIACTTPCPTNNAITLPILSDINVLGTMDSSSSTYANSTNGLLGSVVAPLTGVGTATATTAMVNKFISVKITGVTVEYRGVRGISLLGFGLLNDPWAQQVTRITGIVQPASGGSGFGGSSYVSNGDAGSYGAMLIQ
jgi:hypothetical protein